MLQRRFMTVVQTQIPVWKQAVNLFGSSNLVAYYKKTPAAGTLVDIINAYNGTVTNASDVTGLGGWTASSFDGTGWGNVDALAAALNCSEGFFHAMVKVSAAADWTDAAFHVVNRTLFDASNVISCVKDGAVSNKIYATYNAGGGGARTPALINVSNTGWFGFGCVWSKTSDTFALLYNGARFDPRDSSGIWTGTPGTNAIASNVDTSASVAWKGAIDHIMFGKVFPTESQTIQLVDIFGLGVKTFTVIGDSISSSTSGWQTGVLGSYNGGNARLLDHAVSGGGIVAGAGAQLMDAQVVASAGDNARMIIVALGVNDNNAGNMTTLQAEYEENIAELKVSNPYATIYGMNVLPVWTNNTVGPEIDKSNIRTAIAAACTAQSITCWDTYTSPWITQAQTSDGLHPTAAGHAAITAQILTRI